MSKKDERKDKDGCPYEYERGSNGNDRNAYDDSGRYIGHYDDGAFYDENGEYVEG